MIYEEVLSGHQQELRRGTVVMAALATLETPGYGYGLLAVLEKSGLSVDANTLYPLLRRLEKQGLLDAEWDTTESRPRKMYKTSQSGRSLLDSLTAEWNYLATSLNALRSEEPNTPLKELP
ncbi:PadR family transcriptional regulator [Paeniglutamicibacter terrestris]|uniref:PadR family transcriptional regulator n=1 Tax=Paeniglutamicibacter terrestris TaxID=2723403 RepID=A0ABX1G7T1_9MICC|nr:helix-turn-helix transcriptional regulator [Paeniglutamicibacter terrestris]NKG22304.1 PadR family transcriptional regulator [Paeniglutamicibacter terrestris]